MSKTRRWLTLVIAATLLLGTLAPTAAIAHRSDRPTDLPDGPPLQYGDPDPTPTGPQVFAYGEIGRFVLLRGILLNAVLLRLGLAPIVIADPSGRVQPADARSSTGAQL